MDFEEAAFEVLVDVSEDLKDRMEFLGVSVTELSRQCGMSAGRVRRVLRAQNSRLTLKDICTLGFALGLKVDFCPEDKFIGAVRKGMTQKRKVPDTEFRRRYAVGKQRKRDRKASPLIVGGIEKRT